jgi:hypothetical protein
MGFGYTKEAFLAAYEMASNNSTTTGDSSDTKDSSLVIGADTVLTLPSYKELFLRTVKVAKGSLSNLGKGILFSIFSVLIFGGGAMAFIAYGAYLTEASFWVSVGLFLVWIILFILLLSASLTSIIRSILRRDKGEDYKEHIRWSFSNIIAILLVGLYVNIFTQIGFSLLIIPGVIIAVYTLFAVLLTISGESEGLAALVLSASIINGRFFPVLGRALAGAMIMLLLLVLALGASALTVLINPILLPTVLIPLALIIVYAHTCFSVVLFESVKVLPRKAELPIKETTLINIMRLVIGGVVVGMLTLALMFGYGFSAIYDNQGYSEEWSVKNMSIDITKKTYLKVLSEQIAVYKEENGSYEGACLNVEIGSVCFSDAKTYLLEIPLSNGFYCIDNTGYNEVTRRSSIIFGVCDKERVSEEKQSEINPSSIEPNKLETN